MFKIKCFKLNVAILALYIHIFSCVIFPLQSRILQVCHVVSSHVMPSRDTSYYAMSCHFLLCHVVRCPVMPSSMLSFIFLSTALGHQVTFISFVSRIKYFCLRFVRDMEITFSFFLSFILFLLMSLIPSTLSILLGINRSISVAGNQQHTWRQWMKLWAASLCFFK